jgi:hypothetical protein
VSAKKSGVPAHNDNKVSFSTRDDARQKHKVQRCNAEPW